MWIASPHRVQDMMGFARPRAEGSAARAHVSMGLPPRTIILVSRQTHRDSMPKPVTARGGPACLCHTDLLVKDDWGNYACRLDFCRILFGKRARFFTFCDRPCAFSLLTQCSIGPYALRILVSRPPPLRSMSVGCISRFKFSHQRVRACSTLSQCGLMYAKRSNPDDHPLLAANMPLAEDASIVPLGPSSPTQPATVRAHVPRSLARRQRPVSAGPSRQILDTEGLERDALGACARQSSPAASHSN